MSCKCSVACDDDTLANLTVVGNVSVGHEETIPAYSRHAAIVGASMNCRKLSNDAFVTDLGKAFGTFELEILGISTQHRAFTHGHVTT
jgi:hypothetical protein